MKNSTSGESEAKSEITKSSEHSSVLESRAESQSRGASSDGRQTYYVVDNTPFVIVWYQDAYRIAVGKQIVSDRTFARIPTAEQYVKNKPWELIFALIHVIINFNKK